MDKDDEQFYKWFFICVGVAGVQLVVVWLVYDTPGPRTDFVSRCVVWSSQNPTTMLTAMALPQFMVFLVYLAIKLVPKYLLYKKMEEDRRHDVGQQLAQKYRERHRGQ